MKKLPKTPRVPHILALDTSTHTGWAHSSGKSGVIHLPERKQGVTNGERFDYFYNWLIGITSEHITRFIVYESGSHKRGGAPMEIGIGLPAVLQLFGYQHGIAVKPINTGTIKKHATGKGNAKKPEMLAAALKRFPTVEFVKRRVKEKGKEAVWIPDDNHVDALWLLDLALSEIDW
jgi:hypothetical protein